MYLIVLLVKKITVVTDSQCPSNSIFESEQNSFIISCFPTKRISEYIIYNIKLNIKLVIAFNHSSKSIFIPLTKQTLIMVLGIASPRGVAVDRAIIRVRYFATDTTVASWVAVYRVVNARPYVRWYFFMWWMYRCIVMAFEFTENFYGIILKMLTWQICF